MEEREGRLKKFVLIDVTCIYSSWTVFSLSFLWFFFSSPAFFFSLCDVPVITRYNYNFLIINFLPEVDSNQPSLDPESERNYTELPWEFLVRWSSYLVGPGEIMFEMEGITNCHNEWELWIGVWFNEEIILVVKVIGPLRIWHVIVVM